MQVQLRHKNWTQAVAALGVGALALTAPARDARAAPQKAATLRVGQKLPAFALKDINGRAISSGSLKNKAVWLTFFHST